jgi:hypothetical protein
MKTFYKIIRMVNSVDPEGNWEGEREGVGWGKGRRGRGIIYYWQAYVLEKAKAPKVSRQSDYSM